MLVNVGLLVLGILIGGLFMTFFYRNNSKKITDMVDTINSLKDQLKKK